MRILRLVCGIAVLLITLAFGEHVLHHSFAEASHEAIRSRAFWAVIGIAMVVAIFGFVGGCLLLRRNK
jgi:hypothetical protein